MLAAQVCQLGLSGIAGVRRLIWRPEVNRSDEVRNFYERMPYPAPLTNLDEHRNLYKNQDRRRAEFHLMWPAERPRGTRKSWSLAVARRRPRGTRSASPMLESRRSTSATRACATRAIFSASTIWRTSNSINSRSRASGRLAALSTWWSAQECCITCLTRTSVFAPFATSCVRTARCA